MKPQTKDFIRNHIKSIQENIDQEKELLIYLQQQKEKIKTEILKSNHTINHLQSLLDDLVVILG